jgi:phosphoribosyl 1,2-cyclic phosphodiesterase
VALQLCILGSGSSGNCIYVASDRVGMLIDAGLSGKETIRRLSCIDVEASSIRAICLTHEHSDHITGIPGLHRSLDVELYANSGTAEAVDQSLRRTDLRWQIFAAGSPFVIEDITIEPFSVCHDSFDPVGYVISADGLRIGIATDLGKVTSLVRERLSDCDVLVIEANHSAQMLRDAARPWALKQRISGRRGHLSNDAAAALISEIASERLRRVYLAHISDDCNRPDIATTAIENALAERKLKARVLATYRDRPAEVWYSSKE